MSKPAGDTPLILTLILVLVLFLGLAVLADRVRTLQHEVDELTQNQKKIVEILTELSKR